MLDVVISVDSVIAHLAGALGKKTFLLLPEKSSFLWMNERKDSPWYPSIKIFRQSTLGRLEKTNGRTYVRASIMTASIKKYFHTFSLCF
jgi:ADP-heptose:LPS heptosyltransferase